MHSQRHSIENQEAFARERCGLPFEMPEDSKNVSGEEKQSVGKDSRKSKKSVKKIKIAVPAALLREPVWRRILRTWGGTGFVFSLAFHAILFVLAAIWVTTTIVDKAEPPQDFFVTGAGGGNDGASRERLKKSPKVQMPTQRITAKNATASSIVLPEFDMTKMGLAGTGISGLADGFGFGDGGSGSGGGSGGGIGKGKGIGVGDAKSFVGGFKIMGTEIKAEKLAVYLDCSASMTPYLPAVKEEIYALFPDADIFEFNAIFTHVRDGELVGGKRFHVDKNAGRNARDSGEDATDESKLSMRGKQLYKKYASHFATGSIGAWLDVVLEAHYDGIVVFSDFEDGLRQWDGKNRVIFAESRYFPKLDDERKPKDRVWLDRWMKTIKSRRGKPAVYCYTISRAPQEHFHKLVEATGGSVTDVSYLRKKNSKKTSKSSRRKKRSAASESDDGSDNNPESSAEGRSFN